MQKSLLYCCLFVCCICISVNHCHKFRGFNYVRPNPCLQIAYNITGKTTVCVTFSFMEIKTKSYRSKKELILFHGAGTRWRWGKESYYGGGSIEPEP